MKTGKILEYRTAWGKKTPLPTLDTPTETFFDSVHPPFDFLMPYERALVPKRTPLAFKEVVFNPSR